MSQLGATARRRPTWTWSSRVKALVVCAVLLGCAGIDVGQQAVLLARRGEEQKAIVLLEGYIAEHPGATRERQLLIRVHASVGDLQAAEQQAVALSRVLGERSPVPFIELGHAMELQHRYEEALSLYDKAADVAPRDPAGPRVGGLRSASWGELDAAAERLTEALRRDSGAADVWHALGWVQMQRGEYALADKAYQSGLVAQPDSAENRLGLATVALAQRDYERALSHYEVLGHLRPAFAGAQLGRAWTLILLGRADEAQAALTHAQELGADPKVVRAQRAVLAELRAKASRNSQKASQNR